MWGYDWYWDSSLFRRRWRSVSDCGQSVQDQRLEVSVVYVDEREVGLALDGLEGHEEEAGAHAVFDEGETPAREDAADADLC